MKGKLSSRDLTVMIVIAVAGAALYVFAFPDGAITTLMHQVLKLPGPGAGIGFLVGPAIIACSLFTHLLIKKKWTALITALAFGSIRIGLALNSAEAAPNSFGVVKPLIGLLVLAVSVELLVKLLEKKSLLIKLTVSAVASDITYMIAYWVIVFPATKGWVALGDVPVLLLVTVIGAVLFGALLPALMLKILRKA